MHSRPRNGLAALWEQGVQDAEPFAFVGMKIYKNAHVPLFSTLEDGTLSPIWMMRIDDALHVNPEIWDVVMAFFSKPIAEQKNEPPSRRTSRCGSSWVAASSRRARHTTSPRPTRRDVPESGSCAGRRIARRERRSRRRIRLDVEARVGGFASTLRRATGLTLRRKLVPDAFKVSTSKKRITLYEVIVTHPLYPEKVERCRSLRDQLAGIGWTLRLFVVRHTVAASDDHEKPILVDIDSKDIASDIDNETIRRVHAILTAPRGKAVP